LLFVRVIWKLVIYHDFSRLAINPYLDCVAPCVVDFLYQEYVLNILGLLS
jgi:hypothetical protein